MAAIALVTLGLGLWSLRAGLPNVYHSDFPQAEQAVELLRAGTVVDGTVYPFTLVYGYAAADLAAFAAGRALGWEGYGSWKAFVAHLARREVHHAIGRAFQALCAAMLAVAVYRLARLRFDRRVAVLAAAIAAFCPLQILYAHQVRPHVPVITAVAFAGVAVLRSVLRPTLASAAWAGAATGLVIGIFQIGMPLAVAAAGLPMLFVRPAGALARFLVVLASGAAASWLVLRGLVYHTGFVSPGIGTGVMSQAFNERLGFGMQDRLADLDRLLVLAWQGVMAEPLRAVAALGFLLLCAMRRRSLRDAALYGAFPVIALLAIGIVMGARPRYTMYATPFLAPLAASACLAVRADLPRRLLAAALVLAPLASSVRVDLLLGRPDTRLGVSEIAPGLRETGLRVVAQFDIVPSGAAVPGVGVFPPRGDFSPWLRGESTPRRTFVEQRPDVFIGGRGAFGLGEPSAETLRFLGYVRVGGLGADEAFLPDEPSLLLPELWGSERPGPPIDVWAREPVAARARGALPPPLRAPG